MDDKLRKKVLIALGALVLGLLLLRGGFKPLNLLPDDLTTRLVIGALLLVSPFFLPKDWKVGAIAGIGLLVIVFSLLDSGFGMSIKQEVNQVDQCLKTGTGCERLSPKRSHLPASVVIPSCFEGWSDVVDVKPSYGTVNWSWAVHAQFLFEGEWYDHEPFAHVDTDGFRFCAKTTNQIGKAMPLDWTR